MADPVSWLLIERGWRVCASDGPEVGRVDGVLGDENLDIFDGLSVAGGLLDAPRYVSSDQVQAIVTGSVTLTVAAKEFEHLPVYRASEPPPPVDVSILDRSGDYSAAPPVPEKGRFPILERIAGWFRGTGAR